MNRIFPWQFDEMNETTFVLVDISSVPPVCLSCIFIRHEKKCEQHTL
jgi:hypothetical protein